MKGSIYNANNGKELLEYFFDIYDIKSLSESELIEFFDELFLLKSKKLNVLELGFLSGRIKILANKFKLKTK